MSSASAIAPGHRSQQRVNDDDDHAAIAVVEEQWAMLTSWLEANDAGTFATLRGGATAQQLADAEAGIGRRLPCDLRRLYELCDGQDEACMTEFEQAVFPSINGQGPSDRHFVPLAQMLSHRDCSDDQFTEGLAEEDDGGCVLPQPKKRQKTEEDGDGDGDDGANGGARARGGGRGRGGGGSSIAAAAPPLSAFVMFCGNAHLREDDWEESTGALLGMVSRSSPTRYVVRGYGQQHGLTEPLPSRHGHRHAFSQWLVQAVAVRTREREAQTQTGVWGVHVLAAKSGNAAASQRDDCHHFGRHQHRALGASGRHPALRRQRAGGRQRCHHAHGAGPAWDHGGVQHQDRQGHQEVRGREEEEACEGHHRKGAASNAALLIELDGVGWRLSPAAAAGTYM